MRSKTIVVMVALERLHDKLGHKVGYIYIIDILSHDFVDHLIRNQQNHVITCDL